MHKSIIFFFAFVLLLTPRTFAADKQFTPVLYAETESVYVKPGNTFDAKAYLATPFKTFNISSVTFDLTYDKDVLEATKIDPASSPFDFELVSKIDNEGGVIHFGRLNSTTNSLAGKLPLAVVTFKTKKEGTSNLSFTNIQVLDLNQINPINVNAKTTSMTISQNADKLRPYPTRAPECYYNGIPGRKTDLGCVPDDPVAMVGQFYSFGLSLIGGASLLLMIYGGYLILTSQGNPQMLDRGKNYIYYAIGGLLLAIFGYFFIKFLLGTILQVPGIK